MVEWKDLGSISEIGTGSNNREDSSENGLYPFFVRSKDILKIDHYLFDEEAILIPGEGGIGDIFHYINGKYGLHQRTYRVHPNSSTVNGRYLYYYLFENFKTYINKKSFKATATSIRKPMLTDFPVAIPPLAEQNRIVGILDIFTSSINNLDKQIEQRQKQYEYYRNKLYGESIEELLKNEAEGKYSLKSISELGTITRGKRFTREDVVEKGVPALHYGDMYTYYGLSAYNANTHLTAEKASKMRFCKKGDVVIVGAGENDWDIGVGVVWLGDEKAAVHDACYILEHNQNPMYISHFLRSNVYHLQLRKYVSDAKICSFSAKDLGRIIIPIPSFDRQLSIVRTLDTFESLLSNLKKERELRQKQYEYYREKLLTFA